MVRIDAAVQYKQSCTHALKLLYITEHSIIHDVLDLFLCRFVGNSSVTEVEFILIIETIMP